MLTIMTGSCSRVDPVDGVQGVYLMVVGSFACHGAKREQVHPDMLAALWVAC